MLIILNMANLDAASAAVAERAAGEHEIANLIVLPNASGDRASQIQPHLPGSVLISGTFTAPEIKKFRQQFGKADEYIYCYRPMSDFPFAAKGHATEQRWTFGALEQESRHADVGFPLPGRSADQFIYNAFQDVCYTGELVAPSPHFSRQHAALAADLRAMLPQAELHHIGSTALGIRTKPILDMLLVVPVDMAFATVVPILHDFGFYWVDYPGNNERWYFRHGFPRAMHIHLVRQGSHEERVHLMFRDRLLANERLRVEYESLKNALSQRLQNDRAAYGREKSAFITRVIELAAAS